MLKRTAISARQDEGAIGLAYAVSGFALLSVGDAVVKTMATDWPAFAVAALRFSLGALGLAALLLRAEGPRAFRPTHPKLQVARGACLAFASVAFFSAIYIMPLAEAMAIAFVAPVLTQALAGPLLGERVRPAVYLVSLAALAGVAIILRPNLAELGLAALLPLISATFFALLMIANRASAGQGSALSMQVFVAGICAPILIALAGAAKLSGVPALDFGWPEWHVVARCAIVAVTASSAHWLVYIGTARAGASTIAPAIYVQMLVAVGLGWWWFDNVPDLYTMAGAALIIAAGLYLWRAGARRG
ncbi:DMT family transporter [Erythrobacter sp. HL-111]|uniref:DMT family transporter n=1 Tax=Erythrobacter sp. HL-111 TaxID=1798193 RepID=UPI0006D95AC1|nr:DMT family transporter [Erythrobacter sp. HL-111]KPP93419.1 MAG: putative permease, DMT superfamily [Erythrobacteraceae bacterium HL-111]SDR69960.1 EamA-like transporter family protein [Erythrobacter sp. HL-111]